MRFQVKGGKRRSSSTMPWEEPFWFGMPENGWKCIVKGELNLVSSTSVIYCSGACRKTLKSLIWPVLNTWHSHEYSPSRNGIAPCAAKYASKTGHLDLARILVLVDKGFICIKNNQSAKQPLSVFLFNIVSTTFPHPFNNCTTIPNNINNCEYRTLVGWKAIILYYES